MPFSFERAKYSFLNFILNILDDISVNILENVAKGQKCDRNYVNFRNSIAKKDLTTGRRTLVMSAMSNTIIVVVRYFGKSEQTE